MKLKIRALVLFYVFFFLFFLSGEGWLWCGVVCFCFYCWHRCIPLDRWRFWEISLQKDGRARRGRALRTVCSLPLLLTLTCSIPPTLFSYQLVNHCRSLCIRWDGGEAGRLAPVCCCCFSFFLVRLVVLVDSTFV